MKKDFQDNQGLGEEREYLAQLDPWDRKGILAGMVMMGFQEDRA